MSVYNVITPNLTSNIWWMGTLYGAYLMFMIVEYGFMLLNEHKWATLAGFGRASVDGCRRPLEPGGGIRYAAWPRVLARPLHADLLHCLGGDVRLRGDHTFSPGSAYKFNREQMSAGMIRSMALSRQGGGAPDRGGHVLHRWKMIPGMPAGAGKYEAVMALLMRPLCRSISGASRCRSAWLSRSWSSFWPPRART